MNNHVHSYLEPQAADISAKKNAHKLVLSKKDIVFIVLFFLAAFLIVDFVIACGFNLGFTVAFAALFAVLTAYLFKKNVKVSVFSYVCGALSLVGSVTFALYNDLLLNVFMLFLVCALFGIYICGISGVFKNRQSSFKMLLDVLRETFVSPLSSAPQIGRAYGRALSKNKASKNVLIGIGLSLPVLLVIVPLLVSSDAAFESLVTLVLKKAGAYIAEIVLTVIITPILLFYAVSKKYSADYCSAGRNYAVRGAVQSAVTVSFLSVISLTYLVYLFSQLAYFFSAFSGILPQGYKNTASEYARRGFFEMFFICVINIVMIALANAVTKRVQSKIPAGVKALSAFILGFTVLILITAMQKMKLNVEIYGLSKNRLLVSVFMLMILVVIFFYIVHIFAPRAGYMQPIIILCSVMFIALSFADINGAVAKYNVDLYNSGKTDAVDVDYINNLSDRAVPYILELAETDDHMISKKARTIIVQKIREEYADQFTLPELNDLDTDIVYDPDTDFRSYNYARERACKLLEQYYNALSADERQKLISQYQFDTGEYYYNEENDIYEYYADNYCEEYSYSDEQDIYVLTQKYNVTEYYSDLYYSDSAEDY